VVVNRESVATRRVFAVFVVAETLGFPDPPGAVFATSRGEDWVTPVYVEAESLIASVAPEIETWIVFAPESGFTRYQISEAIPTCRVEVALVRDIPLYVAEATEPVPGESCHRSAVKTRRRLEPDPVVWLQDLVVLPEYPLEILVEVASRETVEAVLDPD
jgi:hypothetical protein